MLKRLLIQNYALIESLDTDISKGFTIITGETGAGKSILLGALSMVMGQRADSQSLLNPEKKCIIEAEFDLKGYGLQSFFAENDLDYADTTTIRREIAPDGKSRAFVNDSPVGLGVLKDLSSQLIDIHSQHQTLLLNRPDFQLDLLDAFAQNQTLLKSYQEVFRLYTGLQKKKNELNKENLRLQTELDFIQFQFQELSEAGLDDLDQESLEHELQQLTHAEEITSALEKTEFLLEDEPGLRSVLNEALSSLRNVQEVFADGKELLERLSAMEIEVKEILREIPVLKARISMDPARVEELNTRLNALYHLQKKHRVQDITSLIEIRENFDQRLQHAGNLEEEIRKVEQETERAYAELTGLSQKLHESRKQNIPDLEKQITALLSELSLPAASVKFELLDAEDFHKKGHDRINLLFSANLGSGFKEVSKVASGGELSRLMLAVKSILAGLISLPTIIFDEIDTGISGEVAQKTGNVMKNAASRMQVIAITHLPQIAGKGDAHLFVYKEERGGKTYSRIRSLSGEERIMEIAKMLSGETPTPAALANAKELLEA